MVATVAPATAANRKATIRLKVAAHQLERQLPPQDGLAADDTQVSEVPSSKPRPRQSSVAACALCATALEALEAGARAGHICTHQQVEPEDDKVSSAGSEQPADPPPRGGKHRQPDEFVIRQYMESMDERINVLVQTVAILVSLLDKDGEKDYENHLLVWSSYCEGLKDRAREVISMGRREEESLAVQWMLMGNQVKEEHYPQQQSHLQGTIRVTPSQLSRSHRA
jgi:hypothetical protein